MPRVRVAEKRIWVDAESRALLHGEVHYWRLSPARWRNALRAARDLGLDVIRGADGAVFLVAVNNGEDALETSVALSGGYRTARDLFSGRTWRIDHALMLRLARKSGTVVQLDPTEPTTG